MTNEQFLYLDELRIQLPVHKFIKGVKTALIEYMKTEENFNRFVENVRLLMHLNNMTVETLSTAGGFNRSYAGRLLRKEHTHRKVSMESLRKLATILSVKPSLLLKADINKQFRKALEEESK